MPQDGPLRDTFQHITGTLKAAHWALNSEIEQFFNNNNENFIDSEFLNRYSNSTNFLDLVVNSNLQKYRWDAT